MPTAVDELWDLVWGRPEVDPDDLASAIGLAADEPGLDYRTRLLIRDGVEALRQHWGPRQVDAWLACCPSQGAIDAICREEFERPGFPILREQLCRATRPEDVRCYLRELGAALDPPACLALGGTESLILGGYLLRATRSLTVIGEVPAQVRSRHALLDELGRRHRLRLTAHPHGLPAGWERRLHTLAPFGKLQVALADVYDVSVSKLFSGRRTDRDDLRFVRSRLDKATLSRRVRETAGPWLREPALRQHADMNWYIIFGDQLPS